MVTTELESLKIGLLTLINGGAAFRIAYCAFQMMHDNERDIYLKRIRYALVFTIIANALIVFKDVIANYFPM